MVFRRIGILIVVVALIAPTASGAGEALVVEDPAGDSLIPSDSYDLRRLTVSGTGDVMVVTIEVQRYPSSGFIPDFALTFASPSALPGHDHYLQCRDGNPLVCKMDVTTAHAHPAPTVHVVERSVTEVAAALDYENASLVVTIAYDLFLGASGDAISRLYLASYMCLNHVCAPGDVLDARSQSYTLP